MDLLRFVQQLLTSQLEINHVIHDPTEINQNKCRPTMIPDRKIRRFFAINHFSYLNSHLVGCCKMQQRQHFLSKKIAIEEFYCYKLHITFVYLIYYRQ